jgi:hypothetical protein
MDRQGEILTRSFTDSGQLRIFVILVLVTVVIHRMHRHDNCLEERGWQREVETGRDNQVAISENVTSPGGGGGNVSRCGSRRLVYSHTYSAGA